MPFKPLLAPNDDPQKNPNFFKMLQYPLLASPKLDGIRALPMRGIVFSRTMKPLPSIQVQKEFGYIQLLDGELIEGSEYDRDVYNRTQSYVMSIDKIGDLSFHVFDTTDEDVAHLEFYKRLEIAEKHVKQLLDPLVKLVIHKEIENYDELIAYEEEQLALGMEGIMMRSPFGPYKHNRSTMREGYLIKLKRFQDAEGFIVGFEEMMHNNNVATRDERGYMHRSSAKEGLVPGNTVGMFLVSYQGEVIRVAPGMFKKDELQAIWNYREAFIGKILKFRYFGHGVKNRPRFPRALGFRDVIDLV